jgi:radical SAM superfamily enzyme YgiQ (UPF0313 family)
MQKDILFTHSYFLRFDPKEYRAMAPCPPLGTLYAASVARGLGYSVDIFDSMLARDESGIIPLLESHRPKIVVIYDDDFNYLTKMCLTRMREAAFILSRFARSAGCTVIVHGSDPADHLREYFDNGADYVVCGEGEQTLGELLGALLRGAGDPHAVRGIAYMSAEGVQRTAAREVMQNLDLIPFPAWDLIDAERYRALWVKHHGHFSLNMVTTRGCPFHCNWCAKPLYGQVYNSRSPSNVVDEMLLLRATINPDHIWFCDDIFGLKPGWVREFSLEVVRRGAALPFKCLGRVDLLLKDDVITSLRLAGCTSVWVGAESGSQKILDAMEKGTTVAQIAEAARRLKIAGIRTGFFLQYGYPGETREDIERTLAMVKECRPDDIGISVSYPLPGTRFFDNVSPSLGRKHNWVNSEDLDLMYPGEFHPDFYRALHRVTHKRLRMLQGFDQVRELAKAPWKISPGRLRRIAAMCYHGITLPPLRVRMDSLARLT